MTLPDDVLAAVDDLARAGSSRSAVIERVLRDHLARQAGGAGGARDLETLNHRADRLDAEAADVLDYQTAWPEG